MASGFEMFVAERYLRARRKEAVISIITVISVCGVAAGVMALVIALAVTNGFRNTLQRNMLGAMAHIDVMNKRQLDGIENWRELEDRIRKLPHVIAVAPALYMPVFLSGAVNGKGGIELKGIDVDAEMAITGALKNLKAGSLDRLRDPNADPPGILLGSRLVEETGMILNSKIKVVSPEGKLTPYGPVPAIREFYVSGIFKTNFSDFDEGWAFTSIQAAQKALSLDDVVNQIEVNVDDLNRADEYAKEIQKAIGPAYTTSTWKELNKQLFNALNLERIVTMIVIGLILLVAALNILITLVMMVMEKYRDIAVLMSMGARRRQVWAVFTLHGIAIGGVGTLLGLIFGYGVSWFANARHLIPLQADVYALSSVPFHARPWDGLWIALAALTISFLATLYPSLSAAKLNPVEILRYE